MYWGVVDVVAIVVAGALDVLGVVDAIIGALLDALDVISCGGGIAIRILITPTITFTTKNK